MANGRIREACYQIVPHYRMIHPLPSLPEMLRNAAATAFVYKLEGENVEIVRNGLKELWESGIVND